MNFSSNFIVQTTPAWVKNAGLKLTTSHTLLWISDPPPLSLKGLGRQQQQCPVKMLRSDKQFSFTGG